MQPPLGCPTKWPNTWRFFIENIECNYGCLMVHCGTKCWIVSKPKIVPEPDNDRGLCHANYSTLLASRVSRSDKPFFKESTSSASSFTLRADGGLWSPLPHGTVAVGALFAVETGAGSGAGGASFGGDVVVACLAPSVTCSACSANASPALGPASAAATATATGATPAAPSPGESTISVDGAGPMWWPSQSGCFDPEGLLCRGC